MNKKHNSQRRTFLKTLGLGIASIPVLGLLRGRQWSAMAADMPEVAETDTMAIALGYVKDGKKADLKKFPKAKDAHSGVQHCTNCMFFGNEKAGKGTCQLFPGKLVKSAGWCNSWAKKA